MELAFVIIYAVLTSVLILLKAFKVGRRRRGALKMITATMFVIAGVYGCVINGFAYCWILFAGLCFAYVGDLLLVFADSKGAFAAGVAFFGCASLSFITYSFLSYGLRWWALIIFAAVFAANVLAQIFKLYNFGGKGVVYMNLYAAAVTLCGSLGLSVLLTALNTSMILFGLGCFMYQISDVFLGLYMYKFKFAAIDAINTALYFPGMFFIALSAVIL